MPNVILNWGRGALKSVGRDDGLPRKQANDGVPNGEFFLLKSNNREAFADG
jgi:hypothetical protein